MAIVIHMAVVAMMVFGGTLRVRAAPGEFVTILPSADTTLMEYFPSNNFGGGPYFNSGSIRNATQPSPYPYPRNRGLLQFDVAAQVPQGSRILAVTLVIEVTLISVNNPDTGAQYNFHRMLRPWGEGTKTNQITPPTQDPAGLGALATEGEATWQYRFAFTTNTWAAPGGALDVDFSADISVSKYFYGPAFSPYYISSTAGLVADVQYWLDQPANNFGWMLKVDPETDGSTARRFGSREGSMPARIQVEYLPPPTVLSVEMVEGGEFRLSFAAYGQQAYSVEYADSLPATMWTMLTNVSFPTNTPVLITDFVATNQARLYRVQLQQLQK